MKIVNFPIPSHFLPGYWLKRVGKRLLEALRTVTSCCSASGFSSTLVTGFRHHPAHLQVHVQARHLASNASRLTRDSKVQAVTVSLSCDPSFQKRESKDSVGEEGGGFRPQYGTGDNLPSCRCNFGLLGIINNHPGPIIGLARVRGSRTGKQ